MISFIFQLVRLLFMKVLLPIHFSNLFSSSLFLLIINKFFLFSNVCNRFRKLMPEWSRLLWAFRWTSLSNVNAIRIFIFALHTLVRISHGFASPAFIANAGVVVILRWAETFLSVTSHAFICSLVVASIVVFISLAGICDGQKNRDN
mgnify:FL=1